MKNEKKNDRYVRPTWFLVGVALTVVGFSCIPPLIKKYGNRVYKESLNTKDVDFDNMGPEIKSYENVKGEE